MEPIFYLLHISLAIILLIAIAYYYQEATKAKEVGDILKEAKFTKEKAISDLISKYQNEDRTTLTYYKIELDKYKEETRKSKELLDRQARLIRCLELTSDGSEHYILKTKLITITEFDENGNAESRDIQISLTAQQYHSLCEKVCLYYDKGDTFKDCFTHFLRDVFPGTYSFFKKNIKEDKDIIDYDDFSSITSYNFKFKEEDLQKMYEDYITPNKFKDFS